MTSDLARHGWPGGFARARARWARRHGAGVLTPAADGHRARLGPPEVQRRAGAAKKPPHQPART
ncbi:hypothetical protein ACIPPM_25130 [Streptomyces sp. NPDC090119]|uniref:hypothetical protein n=1 Tax=Streptomyces sp. NPDC090119 TaxID=3365951 RepID=UPI00382909A1